MEQIVSIAYDESGSSYVKVLMDLDNSTESEGDQKEEKKIKEYSIDSHFRLSERYKSSCSDYGQLEFKHSLEVMLDVVTPPPEV